MKNLFKKMNIKNKLVIFLFALVLFIGAPYAFASIPVSSNFLLTAQLPLDARTVVADSTARDAIPAGQRYDGLSVYLTSTQQTYQLQGGILNTNWVLAGGGVNIYNSNGTLTGSRTVSLGGHPLEFSDSTTPSSTGLGVLAGFEFGFVNYDSSATNTPGATMAIASGFGNQLAEIGIAHASGDGFQSTLKFTNAAPAVFTDSIFSTGLEYAADYSANFVARSLIDKGYADATYAPIAGLSTGINGLNGTSNIGLGGTITSDTTILLGANHTFQLGTSSTNFYIANTFSNNVTALTNVNTLNTSEATVSMDEASMFIGINPFSAGLGESGFNFGNGGAMNYEDDNGLSGFSYFADYSANGIAFWGDRWIPDAGYVNAQILVAVPSQTGNSGKFLTTNGSTTSWGTVSGGTGTVTSVATNATLTGGPITTTGTLGLNLSNANIWAALQTFGTNISIGGVTATGATGTGNVVFATAPSISGATITTSSVNGVTLTTGGSTSSFLNANGAYSVPAGAISSVSNSDGTLTISPTTGAVVASLSLGHANTWTGAQIFSTKPVTISGNQSASAWTTNGTQLSVAAASLTDTSSSGTVTTTTANAFGTPTLLASSSTTYTNAATLYVAGAPIASTNVAITNAYALDVASGTSFLGGNLTQRGRYCSLGPSAPNNTVLSAGTSPGCEYWGTDNTINGVEFGAGNTSTGTSAYNFIFQNNDLASDGLSDNYAGTGLTSSGYTDTTFGTGAAVADQYQIWNTMGPVAYFATKSGATGRFDWFVGGSATANEEMQLNNTGLIIEPTSTISSGVANIVSVVPTINSSGSASSRSLMIYPFLQTVGSGANLLISAGTASAAGGGGSLTQVFSLSSGGQVAIGSGTSRTAVLNVGGNLTSAAWGTTGVEFNTQVATYSDNTSGAGTVTSNAVNSLAIVTLTTPTNAVTYTNAATLYINGAPIAGTNVTLTNDYALYSAAGTNFFGGNINTVAGVRLALGGAAGGAQLILANGLTTGSAYGTTGFGAISVNAATYSSTTSTGTIAVSGITTFAIPTLTATNATTLSKSATVYIAGAPVASTNVTQTASMALYVAGGVVQFDGTFAVGNGLTTLQGATIGGATGGNDFNTGTVGNAATTNPSTATLFQFAGSTTVSLRTYLGGTNAAVASTANYTNFMVGSAPIQTFSSGVHPWFNNATILPLGTIAISGTGSVTNSSTLYIGGMGSGATNNYGIYSVSPFASAVTQTVVNCSTSGTVTFSEPFDGPSYRQVIAYEAACLGTASYTFPRAFTNTPDSLGLNAVKFTSISTTATTVTGTTTTGFSQLYGY